jgi:hypothetical protein
VVAKRKHQPIAYKYEAFVSDYANNHLALQDPLALQPSAWLEERGCIVDRLNSKSRGNRERKQAEEWNLEENRPRTFHIFCVITATASDSERQYAKGLRALAMTPM